MLTRTEKTYLALTIVFLAAGSGLQAWRRAGVEIGPFPDQATIALDSARNAGTEPRTAPPGTDAVPGNAPRPGEPGTGAHPDTSAREGTSILRESARAGGAGEPVPREGAPSMEGPASRGVAPGPAGSAGATVSGSERIDLNRADAAGLMRIKGVGAKTAEAILAHRRAHGPFRSLRDLLRIKGIGEKKLEKLAPHIIL